MKLPLLKILYSNSPPTSLEELIGTCDRYFPHWVIGKTEAQKLLTELQQTAFGPGEKTVLRSVKLVEESVEATEVSITGQTL